MDADVSYEGRSYLLFLSLYGIPATIGGIYLISQDYKSTAGAFLTYGVGFPLFITGGLSLFLDLIVFAFTIKDSPRKMVDQAQKYWKKEKEWKLRVVPSINFEEPGGGLFLQLGF